jgi:SAM-dependent methyltransferase
VGSYRGGFAHFYDRYGTGWTRQFVPILISYLKARCASASTVIDLACGTGVSTELFCAAGWSVTGIDLSADMLAVAKTRLAEPIADGRVRLVQADARDFEVDRPADACVCLEGALNHLHSSEELRACFERAAQGLRPGGYLVFDLYEPDHFRGWHNISMIDEDEAIVVRRGVWDQSTGVGMLRISGLHEHAGVTSRVEQSVTSRVFEPAQVRELLSSAGLEPEVFDGAIPGCVCRRPDSRCRTVYAARLRTA